MSWRRLLASDAHPAVVLIRVLIGGMFLSEGIQKFLYPEALGAGRFEKIGIPDPAVMAPFVAGVEILGGALLLVGLITRLATPPLLIDICVAIVTTKVPVLLGHGFWGFALPKLASYGLWSMLHEARADFAALLGLLFVLIVGAGRWSVDAAILRAGAAEPATGHRIDGHVGAPTTWPRAQ
ncbi:MAG TPA: DoxX family protein [Chthonomonadaceae bacterium]|nr:DoxX family protein [Chthonomonadaceae bacterium]